MKRILLALALLNAAWIAEVRAEEEGTPPCCAHCGCCCNLRPCCRIVCEMKEVKEWCYDCQCEDFCVPGRSECVGHHPEQDCCGCCKMMPTYKPCWCDMYTRKKLYKRQIVKMVPTYKCVVEYVCADCCGCGSTRHHHHHSQAAPAADPIADENIMAPPVAKSTPVSTAKNADLVPPQPKAAPVVKRAPCRLLPPPPLPDLDRDPTIRQASHEKSSDRLKLR